MAIINNISPSLLPSSLTPPEKPKTQSSFGEFLGEYMSSSFETLSHSETQAFENISGTPDVSQLLSATTEAELKVAELMAIHEKILSSLDRILHQTAL